MYTTRWLRIPRLATYSCMIFATDKSFFYEQFNHLRIICTITSYFLGRTPRLEHFILSINCDIPYWGNSWFQFWLSFGVFVQRRLWSVISLISCECISSIAFCFLYPYASNRESVNCLSTTKQNVLREIETFLAEVIMLVEQYLIRKYAHHNFSIKFHRDISSDFSSQWQKSILYVVDVRKSC